jgi:uncharacterized protein YndB with AHSA1/START domain
VRIEETVQIRRSPEAVWAFVVDHRNDPLWCRKVKSVEPGESGKWTVTHKPVPMRPAMSFVLEQLETDPPRFLQLREDDDVSVFDVEYHLDAAGQGTRFTQISEFEWKKLPRMLHKTFARGVRRDVRGQLRALKRALEAQQDTTQGVSVAPP